MDIAVVQDRRSPLTALTPRTLRAEAALERVSRPGCAVWCGSTLFIRRGMAARILVNLWDAGFTTERRVA